MLNIVDHYSAVKKNKLLIHATTWRNLKCITLKETILKGHLLLFYFCGILKKANCSSKNHTCDL